MLFWMWRQLAEQCGDQRGLGLFPEMEQPPRPRLWIFLVEESKEGVVSKVLKARRVVGHAIHRSWEVEGVVAIAMASLVKAGDVAEEGARSVRADGPLLFTGDCWSVVAPIGESGEGDIVGGGHGVTLGDESTVLEVAVGNGSGHVGGRD